MKSISFAIVGGGPAGFYTAKLLSKLSCQPQIHIYERQLCPFGLIRNGVAPDHISIKRIEMTLSSSIQDYKSFQYIGNNAINKATDLELRQKYSGVIYSFGANGNPISPLCAESIDKQPQIKNARQIVYWYNSHPDYQQKHIDLSKINNVTIIGNGNVAIDISRIFLRKPQELEKTEISLSALQDLKNSSIRNVSIVGRRGVTQSAFALKELRQLHKYGIKLYAVRQELQASQNESSYYQCTALADNRAMYVRMNKRKMDFIKQKFTVVSLEQLPSILKNNEKKVIFRYLLNPKKLASSDTVKQVSFLRTYLKGQPFKQKGYDTEEQVKIEHDMLINSTGFEVTDIDGSQKFKQNRIPNSNGCLTKTIEQNQKDPEIEHNLYTTGWCKTGPQGVIDQTLLGCEQTFNSIRIHYEKKILLEKEQIKIDQIFDPCRNINFDQYKQVRQIELNKGDKAKFIKKKLSTKQIIEMYGLKHQRN